MSWKTLDTNGNVKTAASAGTITESNLSLSDITTADVTSTKHGFAPKSPADATKFLNGAATPAYALVKDSDLSTSDITTNDVSTSKHGFAPKAPNDATKFLNGTGAYSVPTGGGTTTIVSVRISDAQWKSLNTVPVQVVAAPGNANYIIAPVQITGYKSFTGGTYSVARNPRFRHANSAFDLITLSLTNSTNIQVVMGNLLAGGTDAVDVRNQAIEISHSGDVTGGNAANFLEVMITYVTYDMSVT